MAQVRPYVYDPSQQIRKDLSNAAMTVEQGFQNVIDRKKQEYSLVRNQFDNIEALKKDLNRFDNEIITQRSNDLIKKAAATIKEKGKIDFTSLGQLRSEVESIRDAKRNSALKAKSIEEATAYTLKNAANMTDIQGTINQMNSLLRNPDVLFSPKPIDTEIMSIYKKGLNMSKIINDKIDDYLESRAGSNEFSYKNDRGDVIKAEYKQIPGLVPTKNGYDIADIEDKNNPGTKINPLKGIIRQILTPEEISLFAEQADFANALEGDPERLLEPILMSRFNSSVKSKVGVFAEDIARKESLTKATLKRIDLNDKKFELQKQSLDIRRMLADSTIAKNSAQVAKLRDELTRRDAESNRKGIVYDEASGEYVYDESKDATKKDADALLKILGGENTEPKPNTTQKSKNAVAPPVKPNSTTVTSRSGKTMNQDAFFKMSPVQRLQWKNN